MSRNVSCWLYSTLLTLAVTAFLHWHHQQDDGQTNGGKVHPKIDITTTDMHGKILRLDKCSEICYTYTVYMDFDKFQITNK